MCELPYGKDTVKNLYDIVLNLEGVITDVERTDEFDEVCLRTVSRVSKHLYKIIDQLKLLDVPSDGDSNE